MRSLESHRKCLLHEPVRFENIAPTKEPLTPHPSHQNGTTPRCPHRANDPDTALRGRSSGKQSEEVAACYFGRERIERGQYSLPKYQKKTLKEKYPEEEKGIILFMMK